MLKGLQRKWKNKICGYLKFNIQIKDKDLKSII